MALSTYDKCLRIMAELKAEGITKEIPLHELRKKIMVHGGSDPNTLKRYLVTMQDLGMIKQHPKHPTWILTYFQKKKGSK